MQHVISRAFTALSAAVAVIAASLVCVALVAPAAQAAELNFSCEIPGGIGGGKVNCGQTLDLPAGAVLTVDLISSGGYKVKFCAKQSIGDIELGCSSYIDPGAVITVIYQNPSTGPYGIQVTAETQVSTIVDVLAQRRFNYPD